MADRENVRRLRRTAAGRWRESNQVHHREACRVRTGPARPGLVSAFRSLNPDRPVVFPTRLHEFSALVCTARPGTEHPAPRSGVRRSGQRRWLSGSRHQTALRLTPRRALGGRRSLGTLPRSRATWAAVSPPSMRRRAFRIWRSVMSRGRPLRQRVHPCRAVVDRESLEN